MSYRQFTNCVSPGSYIGKGIGQTIVGAAIGAIPLIMALAAGVPAGPAVLIGMIAAVMAVLAYCRWWLYDRLICLGGDVCAVGRLLTVEPPSGKSGLDAFDTDYSINLLLAPHAIGADQATVENDGLQGHLIKNQQAIKDLELEFKGETSRLSASDPASAILHAEFEGGGVYKLMQVCLALLGYLTVATVASAIICAIPVIGWLACLIISLIFAAIAGGILAMGMANALKDTGNPADASEHLGNLEQGTDLLAVRGSWVFDTAHEGWNEIHPIKHCQRIGKWEGSWEKAFDTIRDKVPAGTQVDAALYAKFWCEAIASAGSPLTHGEQAKPQNQWTIHPVIDGCIPRDEPDPHGEPDPIH